MEGALLIEEMLCLLCFVIDSDREELRFEFASSVYYFNWPHSFCSNPTLLSLAAINQLPEAAWEERMFLNLHMTIHQGSQGNNASQTPVGRI